MDNGDPVDIRDLLVEIPRPAMRLKDQPTGIPDGWRVIQSAVVYERAGSLVITATPDEAYPGFEDDDEGHPHSCDQEGCGWEHVVGDGRLRSIQSSS